MAAPLVPDELWAPAAPLLPPEPPKPEGGRPRVDDRACLTGILFVLSASAGTAGSSSAPWPGSTACGG